MSCIFFPVNGVIMSKNTKKKEKNIISYIPWIIGGIILLLIVIAVIRIAIWNKGTDIGDEPGNTPDLATETQDYLFFRNPSLIEGNNYDGEFDVVLLGNDSYLYNVDGESIAEMLQKNVNGTVYNCALKDSRLCSVNDHWDDANPENNNPMDAFDFFWLSESIQYQDYSRHGMNWTDCLKILTVSIMKKY